MLVNFEQLSKDSMPNILWIWDMNKFKLASVLIQTSAIRCVAWEPRQPRLALCTNNNKLYMWSAQGCVAIEAPCEATFLIQSLKWMPNGTALVLVGKDHFCVAYFQPAQVERRATDVNKASQQNDEESSDTENSNSV
jgi:WD40 repeat protein